MKTRTLIHVPAHASLDSVSFEIPEIGIRIQHVSKVDYSDRENRPGSYQAIELARLIAAQDKPALPQKSVIFIGGDTDLVVFEDPSGGYKGSEFIFHYESKGKGGCVVGYFHRDLAENSQLLAEFIL